MRVKNTEVTNRQTGTGETLFYSRAVKETDHCAQRTDSPATDAVQSESLILVLFTDTWYIQFQLFIRELKDDISTKFP